MSRTAGLFFITALALGLAPASAEEAAVDISATPIRQFDSRTPIGATFGKLTFLGGLQLGSRDPAFGGLSGLRLSDDGRGFTAISDRGDWFRGEISYDGRAPAGVANVVREAVVGPRGAFAAGKRGADTEALEIDGRSAWIASERVNEVLRIVLDADGRAGAGRSVALPKEARSAPFNEGFEAIALTKAGALMLIGEKFLDGNGDNRAFVVGTKTPFAFAVKRTENFSPTDLARLPSGGFVLLERRYVRPFSLAIRLRRLDDDAIRSGALVDGPVLMEATLPAQTIDNFEAVSVHPAPGGGAVITVASDDNFSALQRTLLLQFELRD